MISQEMFIASLLGKPNIYLKQLVVIVVMLNCQLVCRKLEIGTLRVTFVALYIGFRVLQVHRRNWVAALVFVKKIETCTRRPAIECFRSWQRVQNIRFSIHEAWKFNTCQRTSNILATLMIQSDINIFFCCI